MNVVVCYESDPDDGVGEMTLDLPAAPRIGDLVCIDENDSRFIRIDDVRWHDEYVWIGGSEVTA